MSKRAKGISSSYTSTNIPSESDKCKVTESGDNNVDTPQQNSAKSAKRTIAEVLQLIDEKLQETEKKDEKNIQHNSNRPTILLKDILVTPDSPLKLCFPLARLNEPDTMFPCPFCNRLLYEPHSLGCGHSICEFCYINSIAVNNRITCQVCKLQVVNFSQTNENLTLKDIVLSHKKSEYLQIMGKDEFLEIRKMCIKIYKHCLTYGCYIYQKNNNMNDIKDIYKFLFLLENNNNKNELSFDIINTMKPQDKFLYLPYKITTKFFYKGIKYIIYGRQSYTFFMFE